MKSLVFLVAIFGLIQLSLGWGEVGHKTIAQIASTLLSSDASNLVSQFLGDKSLADIASIPDQYDHTSEGDWSKPCHYCNLPRDATNFTMDDCPGFCVVKSIFNYTSILSNQTSNPVQCQYGDYVEPCALIFLVHFVGDVHQPLHVGYGYDEGGNSVNVTFFGKQTELHACWDDWIIERWVSTYQDAATQLEQMMQNETEEVKEYIAVTNAIDWADESFGYVRSTVYNFNSQYEIIEDIDGPVVQKSTRGNKMRITKDHLSFVKLIEDEPALADAYYNRNLPIIKQRLIAAAVRLATLLNRILA